MLPKSGSQGFEAAYAVFMKEQIQSSTGERKRRIQESAGRYGEKMILEKVIWPEWGTLDGWHAEYELRDLSGKRMYVDFMFVEELWRVSLGVEADGYEVHVNLNRSEHSWQLQRQNDMLLQVSKLLRFSVDEAVHRPEVCRLRLRAMRELLIGGTSPPAGGLQGLVEREVVKLAMHHGGRISASLLARQLDIDRRTACKYLHHMTQKGCLIPGKLTWKRINWYELHPEYRMIKWMLE